MEGVVTTPTSPIRLILLYLSFIFLLQGIFDYFFFKYRIPTNIQTWESK